MPNTVGPADSAGDRRSIVEWLSVDDGIDLVAEPLNLTLRAFEFDELLAECQDDQRDEASG